MIRLRRPAPDGAWGGYLLPEGSIATDLAGLGVVIEHPEAVDRQVGRFLAADGDGGANQIPPSEFRAILDVFDRHWLHQAV